MGPDIQRNTSNQTLKSFNGYAKIYNNRPESRIKNIWRNSDAVCFDVDSTVCTDEAIDELAAYLGKGAEVAACTQRAMNGSMSFREALRLRLEVMQPTLPEVREYAKTHEISLTPGIIEMVEKLHTRGTDVYLVSGGFRPLIIPVAQRLGIPINRVYANEILYHEDGTYAGFDINEPTSDNGNQQIGKAGVCGILKKLHGYRNLVMIGDGITDAEASPPADAFIGFGGNQVREAVRQQASWYVYDFETLNSELDNRE